MFQSVAIDEGLQIEPLRPGDMVISRAWAPPTPELARLWPRHQKTWRRKGPMPGSAQHNHKVETGGSWENGVRALEDRG